MTFKSVFFFVEFQDLYQNIQLPLALQLNSKRNLVYLENNVLFLFDILNLILLILVYSCLLNSKFLFFCCRFQPLIFHH